ncbi:hypothetical protein L916_14355 [Phytophthora nicotianae]|uniref:RxLR effector PexRD54 WY domain-containing protein n=1 Tax=Phytophthora nicotianae TaxID=4792 RepID=W2IG63_PHYNI|nr:hypothetical protein L916_14355 [Phytophthora nicotianae]
MGTSKTTLVVAIYLVAVVCSTVLNDDMSNDANPTAAYLRPDNTADEDQNNEERGVNLNPLSGLTKLTANINSVVDTARLQIWLQLRTSADDVFRKMKLNSVKGNLLTDPKFLGWVKYVDDLNQKKPEAERISAAAVLTFHYMDDQLSTMLNAAMKNHKTKDLALTLQAQRLEDWRRRNTHPVDVLDLLSLEKNSILVNPVLTSWFKYLDEFNIRHPRQHATRASALSDGLGDSRFAKVLEEGLKADKTKAISKEMERELFAEWGTKKFTPDFIFGVVGLKNVIGYATGPILSDPVFKFWVRYMNEFNVKNPTKRATIFGTLTKNYGDEALVDMLVEAKKVVNTRTAAKSLESQLLLKWLHQKLHPGEVVRWMNADKSNEMLGTYTRLFSARYPKTTSQ